MDTNTRIIKSKSTNKHEYTNVLIRPFVKIRQKIAASIRQFVPICANKGFTLIEVLLAAFIFTVTIGAITVVFTSSSNVQTQNQVIRETNQSVQYAIEAISRDVKAAKSSYYSVSDVQELGLSPDAINKIKPDGKGFEILETGSQLRVLTSEGIKTYQRSGDELVVTIEKDGETKSASLTNLGEVKVNSVLFEGVTPADNLLQQPYVTITISVTSTESVKGTPTNQTLTTTITSNYYPYAFT